VQVYHVSHSTCSDEGCLHSPLYSECHGKQKNVMQKGWRLQTIITVKENDPPVNAANPVKQRGTSTLRWEGCRKLGSADAPAKIIPSNTSNQYLLPSMTLEIKLSGLSADRLRSSAPHYGGGAADL